MNNTPNQYWLDSISHANWDTAILKSVAAKQFPAFFQKQFVIKKNKAPGVRPSNKAHRS